MKIKIIGAGWFGCHLACSLLEDGHYVELHEAEREIFAGASGKIPARLHLGAPHYPRSVVTQQACKSHQEAFMAKYGQLTRAVPINIYAIANNLSLIDFGTYLNVLKNQIEFLTIYDPAEFGLKNVEGAVMTGERHIVIDRAKNYFQEKVSSILFLNSQTTLEDTYFDYVIDCTFCSNDEYMIDRFEPCIVLLLRGLSDKAVTIMDGPFPSLYPWNEEENLLSLSSAKFTPLSKTCKTWGEAKHILDNITRREFVQIGEEMIQSMEEFYPFIRTYEIVDYMFSIRAMPLSHADTRLVHIVEAPPNIIRIRAGKIDAVLDAETQVKEILYAQRTRCGRT